MPLPLKSDGTLVGITNTVVIIANGSRGGLVLGNTGTVDVFFSFHGAAVANKGFWLSAGEKVIIESETTINQLAGIAILVPTTITVEEIL